MRRVALLVVAVAVATRLAAVLWLHETVPYSDFVLYHGAGIEIARDPGFLVSRTAAVRFPQIDLWPPGYPLFLAGVYTLNGPSYRAAIFVQVLLGGLVCWLVMRCTAEALGRRAAGVAGLLVALDPHQVFLTNQLASENLYVLWLALALLLLPRLVATPARGVAATSRQDAATDRDPATDRRDSVATGVVLGLGALTRAIGLVVLLVAWVWLRSRVRGWRPWITQALWLLLGAGLVLLPWTARNAAVRGRPALVCFGGGLNFYFGNNPDRLGYQDLAGTPLEGLRDPVAIDSQGYRLGLQTIATEPLGFLRRGAKKIASLYGFPDYALHVNSGILVPDTRGHPELEAVAQSKLSRQRARDRLLDGPFLLLARGYHLVLLALGALGLAFSWRGRHEKPKVKATTSSRSSKKHDETNAPSTAADTPGLVVLCSGLVLAWTAVHVLFWAQPRFRHPLEIPLAILAAYALERGLGRRARLHA